MELLSHNPYKSPKIPKYHGVFLGGTSPYYRNQISPQLQLIGGSTCEAVTFLNRTEGWRVKDIPWPFDKTPNWRSPFLKRPQRIARGRCSEILLTKISPCWDCKKKISHPCMSYDLCWVERIASLVSRISEPSTEIYQNGLACHFDWSMKSRLYQPWGKHSRLEVPPSVSRQFL